MNNFFTITPGSYLTRGGKEVYIACRANINPNGSKNNYPWIVEESNGRRCWTVNEMGKHMPRYASEFDIIEKIVG